MCEIAVLLLLIVAMLVMLALFMLVRVRRGGVGMLVRVWLVAAPIRVLVLRIIMRVLVLMRGLFVCVRMRMVCHREQLLSVSWCVCSDRCIT